jgi:hypothetical protein
MNNYMPQVFNLFFSFFPVKYDSGDAQMVLEELYKKY